jgi:hypothetical protein
LAAQAFFKLERERGTRKGSKYFLVISRKDINKLINLIEHGDLCILDGADKSAFHAVPRILSFEEAPNTEKFKPSGNSELDSYLRQSRINISLRQCKS